MQVSQSRSVGQAQQRQTSAAAAKASAALKDACPLAVKPVDPPKSYAVILPVSLVMGFLFGFALEKGRVFEPGVIREQMLFQRFQMMKMFLSAVASSIVTMTIVYGTAPDLFGHCRQYLYKIPRGFPIVGFGAFVLGMGMSISGACPGTVAVQLGAGVSQAVLVMLGGLLAAALHSYYEPSFRGISQVCVPQEENRTVDRSFNVGYAQFGTGLFVCLAAAIAGFEFFFPWESELDHASQLANTQAASVLTMRAWPPYVAGAIVGMLQLPAMAMLTVTLGCASSYATVAINLINVVNQKAVSSSAFMTSLRRGLALWQPTYLLGTIIGAFVSSSLSGSLGTVPSLHPVAAFVGGFLLLMGSRLAGGCTSGHGISGMALMASISFVAVPAMFAGGIVTAFTLRGLGLYS